MYKKELMYDFPTPQQCKTLRFITLTTGLLFEGTTKTEASQFIDENLEIANDFKQEKEMKENEDCVKKSNNKRKPRVQGVSRPCFGSDNIDQALMDGIDNFSIWGSGGGYF